VGRLVVARTNKFDGQRWLVSGWSTSGVGARKGRNMQEVRVRASISSRRRSRGTISSTRQRGAGLAPTALGVITARGLRSYNAVRNAGPGGVGIAAHLGHSVAAHTRACARTPGDVPRRKKRSLGLGPCEHYVACRLRGAGHGACAAQGGFPPLTGVATSRMPPRHALAFCATLQRRAPCAVITPFITRGVAVGANPGAVSTHTRVRAGRLALAASTTAPLPPTRFVGGCVAADDARVGAARRVPTG